MSDLNRLTWRCRRGVKELDLALGGFLKSHYTALPSDQKQLFRELLELPDPDIARWLWGLESAPERWVGIIERIKRSLEQDVTNPQ